MSKQLGKATSCLGPCEPLRQPCLHPTPPRVQLPMTPYSAHVCARRPVPKLTLEQSSASDDAGVGVPSPSLPGRRGHRGAGSMVTQNPLPRAQVSTQPCPAQDPRPGSPPAHVPTPGSGLLASAPQDGLTPPPLWQKLLLFISIQYSCALLCGPSSLRLEADEPVHVAERW